MIRITIFLFFPSLCRIYGMYSKCINASMYAFYFIIINYLRKDGILGLIF